MIVGVFKHHLKVGMFVESVDCPSSEFSRRRFTLRSQKDIEGIRQTTAKSVLINTELGIAPAAGFDAGVVADGTCTGHVLEASTKRTLGESVKVVADAFEAARTAQSIDTTALEKVVGRLEEAAYQAPDVLVTMSRLKVGDEATFLHSVSVSALMMRVGQVMNMDEGLVADLGMAGLLHDVGKIFIPQEILAKPGQLTATERESIRNHPKAGFEFLMKDGRFPPRILEVCLSHHEHLDGSGYPFGISRRQLGLHVRIATVCDVFDALTTVRPYKDSWSTERAIAWLYQHRNRYDARIVGRLSDAIQAKLVC